MLEIHSLSRRSEEGDVICSAVTTVLPWEAGVCVYTGHDVHDDADVPAFILWAGWSRHGGQVRLGYFTAVT